VRNRLSVCLCLLMFAVLCSAAQRGTQPSSGEEFVGTWSGSWDAGGSGGGFELTLEEGKDGAVTGRVSVTGEPTYKASFSALSFDGKKMTAKYSFPPDEGGEVVLALGFDGKKASGTWTLKAKADGTQFATGTVDVAKK
jgi:hypothetical protein